MKHAQEQVKRGHGGGKIDGALQMGAGVVEIPRSQLLLSPRRERRREVAPRQVETGVEGESLFEFRYRLGDGAGAKEPASRLVGGNRGGRRRPGRVGGKPGDRERGEEDHNASHAAW